MNRTNINKISIIDTLKKSFSLNKYSTDDKNKSVFDSLKIYDYQKAFENAIKKGMKNPDDWMYMYSTRFRDYFKYYWTRKYTSCFNFKNIFK